MPAFFVPSRSPEEAKRFYQRLVSEAGIKDPQRLFRLCWAEKKLTLDGQVGGCVVKGAADNLSDDRVCAIIDAKQHLLVYLESNPSSPIFVLPEDVIHRSYFDDYPGLGTD
jgi:hypothetical protein